MLELDRVSFDYGDGAVLSDVSFRVAPREVVALVGLSGAGKSTALALAAGMIAPTPPTEPPGSELGTVRTLGVDLDRTAGRARRKVLARVGVVPQQPVMPGTLRVIHNVNAGRLGSWGLARSLWSLASPRGVSEARVALARVGIEDLVDARTDSLSGGQLQRVAVARVLAAAPDLILADEPTSAVDPSWSREVLDALLECADAGAGVLVSLHDVELARSRCHRIVGLRHGRVVATGPSSEFTPARLDDLYRLDRESAP